MVVLFLLRFISVRVVCSFVCASIYFFWFLLAFIVWFIFVFMHNIPDSFFGCSRGLMSHPGPCILFFCDFGL